MPNQVTEGHINIKSKAKSRSENKVCVRFQAGSLKVTPEQASMLLTKHMYLCCDGGTECTVEYGLATKDHKMDVTLASINPELFPDQQKLVALIEVDGKQVAKTEVTKQQLADLVKNETRSQLVKQYLPQLAQASQIPERPPTPQLPQRAQLRQAKQKAQAGEKPKLQPGTKANHVINPETGHEIKIGGPTYNDLCATGHYTC